MDILKALGGGGLGNMANLLKQAQDFQQNFEKFKAEAGSKYFEAESGEGRVKVRMTGLGVVDTVEIAPELFSAADKSVLEGLLQLAINDVIEKVKENVKGEVSKAAGDMQLPGM